MTRSEPTSVAGLDRLKAARLRIRSRRTGRILFRTVVAVLGTAIVAIGVALLALPGPGWLIIFAGLGILSSEFEWASRLLGYARRRVSSWTDRVGAQGRPTQLLIGTAGLVVLGGLFAAAWWFYAV